MQGMASESGMGGRCTMCKSSSNQQIVEDFSVCKMHLFLCSHAQDPIVALPVIPSARETLYYPISTPIVQNISFHGHLLAPLVRADLRLGSVSASGFAFAPFVAAFPDLLLVSVVSFGFLFFDAG